MALPAGRVGVAPNQVDSNGNIFKQPVPTVHIEEPNYDSLQATGILFITINDLSSSREITVGGNTFYMFGAAGASGAFPVDEGATLDTHGAVDFAMLYYIK